MRVSLFFMSMRVSIIRGDGIGSDCIECALLVVEASLKRLGLPLLTLDEIAAGAKYYQETGKDIEPDGEKRAASADAILLGTIGLPNIRYADGTEISPHLRLRDNLGLYAGVRPVRVWPHVPHYLKLKEAQATDIVLIRESTEGLFYSAAVHDRSVVHGDDAVDETLRITRKTSEKLHRFAFRLAEKRKAQGKMGKVTCVDKANVFKAMAFFRKIFDEVSADFPEINKSHFYVDAMALELVRSPWEFDVVVTENMFGDILSDLIGGLVGGMGVAPCGEIGDEHGLFQPSHGSAPDIAGQDKANPLATILSGGMMLNYLGERSGDSRYEEAGALIERAVESGFESGNLKPIELGGSMGTIAMGRAVTEEVERVA